MATPSNKKFASGKKIVFVTKRKSNRKSEKNTNVKQIAAIA